MIKIFNKYIVTIKDRKGKTQFSSQVKAFSHEESINVAWDHHLSVIEGRHPLDLLFPLSFESIVHNE